MKTKHTQGPWRLRHTGKHDGDRCVYSSARDICRIDGGPGDDYEQFANAVLIASSPTMLGALQSTKRWMEDCLMDRGVPGLPSRVAYDVVCAAINKAIGEVS